MGIDNLGENGIRHELRAWVVGECGAYIEDEMGIPDVLLLVLPLKQHGVLALVDWFSNEVSLRC